MSSDVGEAKLFSFFATAFFCAVTFSFLFCTAVVNDGSSFYYLGRVGEKGREKSGRCGVKGKNVFVERRKFRKMKRIRCRFEGRKVLE